MRFSNVTSSIAVTATKSNTCSFISGSTKDSLSRNNQHMPAVWVRRPALDLFCMPTDKGVKQGFKNQRKKILMWWYQDFQTALVLPLTFLSFSYFDPPCVYCSVNSTKLRSCPTYQEKYWDRHGSVNTPWIMSPYSLSGPTGLAGVGNNCEEYTEDRLWLESKKEKSSLQLKSCSITTHFLIN